MGIFNRRQGSQLEIAPTVMEAELASASVLLDRWDHSLGNSSATWACIEEIARRGGFTDSRTLVAEVAKGRNSSDVVNRPWRWWAEATRVAYAHGDDVLASRIFLFAYLFVDQVLPFMTAADQFQTGLGPPDEASYLQIAASAATSLAALPSDLVLHDTATGVVDVKAALGLVHKVLEQ